MATKSELRAAERVVVARQTELTDPYTVALGPAAVRCVRESLDAATARLERMRAGAL